MRGLEKLQDPLGNGSANKKILVIFNAYKYIYSYILSNLFFNNYLKGLAIEKNNWNSKDWKSHNEL